MSGLVSFQIVFFLLCMCLFCTIACGVWEALTGERFQVTVEHPFYCGGKMGGFLETMIAFPQEREDPGSNPAWV
jgi:hypothetical protein